MSTRAIITPGHCSKHPDQLRNNHFLNCSCRIESGTSSWNAHNAQSSSNQDYKAKHIKNFKQVLESVHQNL